jgi:FkbM family methyltransferase
MFSALRSFGKRHPNLRAALSPTWQRVVKLLWISRNALSMRPVTIQAGNHTVSMVAKGQIAELVWKSEFEKSERDYAVQQIRPGMRVLNIGANAGLYTILASRLVGAEGEIHAFEPSSHNFGLLRENIELNECQNVVANKLALSNFKGQLSLYSDPEHPDRDGHFFVRELTGAQAASSKPMEIIPCTTLDDYWREAGGGKINAVDFIIIDVEGAELSVFEGARQTFASSPNLTMIMECTERVPEIGSLLREFEFDIYHWGSGQSQLLPTEIERGSLVALRRIHADVA